MPFPSYFLKNILTKLELSKIQILLNVIPIKSVFHAFGCDN